MDRDFLTVSDLKVNFSRWGQTTRALDGLSFSVPQGQWVLLIGPNGAGKSVCLRSISGRVQLEAGEVLIGDKSVSNMSRAEIADNMFYVHQDPKLGTAATLTIFENLAVADHQAYVKKESKRVLLDKYHQLLPNGLRDRMHQQVRTLSGGERQILTVAIAGLRPSPLILLDEPTAALDPRQSEICLTAIAKLHQLGKTIIQITHDEANFISVGDRTIVMNEGRLTYDGVGSFRSLAGIRAHWFSNLNGNGNHVSQ
jgi:putative tryptophan/tyrosine transport system ATP-binding protein